MAESPREVFEEVLESYAAQHDHDDYPIIEQSWWPGLRAEWLARFDAALSAGMPTDFASWWATEGDALMSALERKEPGTDMAEAQTIAEAVFNHLWQRLVAYGNDATAKAEQSAIVRALEGALAKWIENQVAEIARSAAPCREKKPHDWREGPTELGSMYRTDVCARCGATRTRLCPPCDVSGEALQVQEELLRSARVAQASLNGETFGYRGDDPLPFGFGKVLNAEPRLIDPTILRYQFHDAERCGPAKALLAVYDPNTIGVRVPLSPHQYTANLSAGTFDLRTCPYGRILCDFIGPDPEDAYRWACERAVRAAYDDGWIHVDERLPEAGEYVLVHSSGPHHKRVSAVGVGYRDGGERPPFFVMADDYLSPPGGNVTHWRPLPEPPSPSRPAAPRSELDEARAWLTSSHEIAVSALAQFRRSADHALETFRRVEGTGATYEATAALISQMWRSLEAGDRPLPEPPK